MTLDRPLLAAVTLAATLLLTACGGAGSSDGHAGHAADESVAAPVEGATEVTVTATDIDFGPASIEVVAGEPVNLTVVNDGETLHDFTLAAADVHMNVEPGDRKTTSFTIDEAGTHKAKCTVDGHAEAGMTVDVIVRAASAS